MRSPRGGVESEFIVPAPYVQKVFFGLPVSTAICCLARLVVSTSVGTPRSHRLPLPAARNCRTKRLT
jgi:hypothetical protein